MMNDESCVMPGLDDDDEFTGLVLLQIICVTLLSIVCYLLLKSGYNSFKLNWSYLDVTVVGAGPVGLLTSLIALNSSRVKTITIYEKLSRSAILDKPYQIALVEENVVFLRNIGVDFDNLEGCWKDGCFFTRVGVLLEYLLSLLKNTGISVAVHFGSKFTADSAHDICKNSAHRRVVLICDGAQGRTASIYNMSENYKQHPCRAYGAVAAIERTDACAVPIPEIRIHNLSFNLSAYHNGVGEHVESDANKNFHLKIFGSKRHRYLTLVVPKVETRLVKTLRGLYDASVMRNIFQVCFNTYRSEGETAITDTSALRQMRFSPRLFDIRLSERLETVTYCEDSDTFVAVEGEATRMLNLHTGLDINIGVWGLTTLEHFLHLAAVADKDSSIESVLMYKHSHTKSLAQKYLSNCLTQDLFVD